MRAGEVPCAWDGIAVVLRAQAEDIEMVFLGEDRKQRAKLQPGTGKRKSN